MLGNVSRRTRADWPVLFCRANGGLGTFPKEPMPTALERAFGGDLGTFPEEPTSTAPERTLRLGIVSRRSHTDCTRAGDGVAAYKVIKYKPLKNSQVLDKFVSENFGVRTLEQDVACSAINGRFTTCTGARGEVDRVGQRGIGHIGRGEVHSHRPVVSRLLTCCYSNCCCCYCCYHQV